MLLRAWGSRIFAEGSLWETAKILDAHNRPQKLDQGFG
ncbi:hypothetical protein XE88_p0003 (plasmid) [Vibrio parahaemolyticus]|nr:hypothetical protein XE88_p0003 [Vibrio parahaemolyticus]